MTQKELMMTDSLSMMKGSEGICCVCKMREYYLQSCWHFALQCVFAYVIDNGRCPVSGLPAGLDHIRKLFEDSSG